LLVKIDGFPLLKKIFVHAFSCPDFGLNVDLAFSTVLQFFGNEILLNNHLNDLIEIVTLGFLCRPVILCLIGQNKISGENKLFCCKTVECKCYFVELLTINLEMLEMNLTNPQISTIIIEFLFSYLSATVTSFHIDHQSIIDVLIKISANFGYFRIILNYLL